MTVLEQALKDRDRFWENQGTCANPNFFAPSTSVSLWVFRMVRSVQGGYLLNVRAGIFCHMVLNLGRPTLGCIIQKFFLSQVHLFFPKHLLGAFSVVSTEPGPEIQRRIPVLVEVHTQQECQPSQCSYSTTGWGLAMHDLAVPGKVASLKLWRVLKGFTSKKTCRPSSENPKEVSQAKSKRKGVTNIQVKLRHKRKRTPAVDTNQSG